MAGKTKSKDNVSHLISKSYTFCLTRDDKALLANAHNNFTISCKDIEVLLSLNDCKQKMSKNILLDINKFVNSFDELLDAISTSVSKVLTDKRDEVVCFVADIIHAKKQLNSTVSRQNIAYSFNQEQIYVQSLCSEVCELSDYANKSLNELVSILNKIENDDKKYITKTQYGELRELLFNLLKLSTNNNQYNRMSSLVFKILNYKSTFNNELKSFSLFL